MESPMPIEEHLNKMKEYQQIILEFLDNEEDSDNNFKNLKNIFNQPNIFDNPYEIKLLLHLIQRISSNHHHATNFYNKICQFFSLFSDKLKKNFSNYEIFRIFKKNKRILLYLIEEKIISIDSYISSNIISEDLRCSTSHDYIKFFYPELKPFLTDEIEDFEIPKNFLEKRRVGENDDYICKLIRDDDIENFVSYITRSNLSLKSTIKPSIYETNDFLLNLSEHTLIEYAAFFGSIQIFRYLVLNKVELNSSLWLFAIHSNNAELIHLLEEYQVELDKRCFIESIKCHHNGIEQYIQNNHLGNGEGNSIVNVNNYLKFYNFEFIEKENINKNNFHILSKYDYYTFVDLLLQDKDLDINFVSIQNKVFLNEIFILIFL